MRTTDRETKNIIIILEFIHEISARAQRAGEFARRGCVLATHSHVCAHQRPGTYGCELGRYDGQNAARSQDCTRPRQTPCGWRDLTARCAAAGTLLLWRAVLCLTRWRWSCRC